MALCEGGGIFVACGDEIVLDSGRHCDCAVLYLDEACLKSLMFFERVVVYATGGAFSVFAPSPGLDAAKLTKPVSTGAERNPLCP